MKVSISNHKVWKTQQSHRYLGIACSWLGGHRSFVISVYWWNGQTNISFTGKQAKLKEQKQKEAFEELRRISEEIGEE